MGTYDHYAETRHLLAMMGQEGFTDAARALDDALRAGSTGSEIFMALRWNIDTFLASKPDGSPGLLRSAGDLRRQLDKVLR